MIVLGWGANIHIHMIGKTNTGWQSQEQNTILNILKQSTKIYIKLT